MLHYYVVYSLRLYPHAQLQGRIAFDSSQAVHSARIQMHASLNPLRKSEKLNTRMYIMSVARTNDYSLQTYHH